MSDGFNASLPLLLPVLLALGVLGGVIADLSRSNLSTGKHVWLHAGREAALRSAGETPEEVAEGPGAQSPGARDRAQTSGSHPEVLDKVPGAEEPVAAVCEY